MKESKLDAEEQDKIKLRIEKNRDEINSLLHRDIPLDLLYYNIRRLNASNERLISLLSENKS